MAEEFVADAPVNVQTLWHGHAQARQHDGDEASGAGAIHVVEVVAWQQFVLVEVPAVAAGHGSLFFLQSSLAQGDFMHKALDDEQAGVAADASTICRMSC